MHKSLFRWRLRFILALICILLTLNIVAIRAQETTPEPEVPAAPTEEPSVEVSAVPTEEPSLPPEATEVITETPVVAEETPEATATEATVEPTLPPEATETPVDTVTPPPVEPIPWSILVREAFNNGDLSPWLPGAGWSIAANSQPVYPDAVLPEGEVDQALQVVNSNEPITFNKETFSNVSVEANFLITQGVAKLSLRQTAPGVDYTVAIRADGQVQLFRAGAAVLAEPKQVAETPNRWHTVRVSAYNDTVTVAVDNTEIVSFQDTEPLGRGYVALSADFGDTATAVDPAANVLLADNFFVWVPLAEVGLYPVPTAQPTPAPTEPPVVEVTAEPTEEVTAVPTDEPTQAPPINAGGKDLSAFPPPSAEQLLGALVSGNNDFPGFTISPAMLPYVDFGDSTAATLETNETEPTCGNNIANTVWFSFTPTTTASYTISTAGSDFDTILAVYTGATVNALTPAVAAPALSCNDDASAALLTSQLTISLTSGTTYRIQVGGFNGRYGTYYMRVQQGAIAAAGIPALVAPTSGIVVNNASPTLDWNPATNGFTYEIQIATAATFTPASLKLNLNVGTVTEYIPTFSNPPFTGPGTYYWRVRALNVNGIPTVGYSAVRNVVYRTAPPTQNLPANAATTTDSTPLFSWLTYGTGAKYQIQVANNPGYTLPTIDVSNITTLNYTPLNPLPPGTWYWRVRATDITGTNPATAYSTDRTLTINILSAPAHNFVTPDTTPTFSWLAATGPAPATQYRLEIDRATTFNSTGGQPDLVVNGLTTLNYTLPTPLTLINPTGYGAYYWRVKISRDSGATWLPASPVEPPFRKLFISPPTPAAPVLFAPASAAATIDTTPILDWNPTTTLPANGGPFTYDLQLCPTAACAAPMAIVGATGLAVTEYTVNPALLPGTYYWRVRTVNAFTVASAYSAARSFVVKTSILATPADNFATVDTTPGFTWAAVPYSSTLPTNVVKYRLEVYSDIGLTALAFSKENLTAATYMMVAPGDTPLAYGDYWWRVLVSVDGIATDYEFTSADVRKINITSSIPLAPTYPAIPAAGAAFADTTPLLQWNDLVPPPTSGWTVVSYDVDIANNSTFTLNKQSFNTGSPASEFQVVTPLNVGTWYLRVRAINSHNAPGGYSAARSFIIRTNPPVLSAPTEGFVTTDTTPLFAWVTFGIGAKYNIEIDDNTGFSSPITNPSLLTVPSFTSPTLTQGVWYWRAQAVDSLTPAGTTAFSAYRTVYVRTQPALPAPVLVSPATGFVTNPLPLLDWNDVVVPPPVGTPGLANFEVQIATNATFANIAQTGTPATSTYQVLAGGITEGTFYWRVRAFNTAGIPGAFSAVRTFIRDTAAVGTLPVLNLPANNSSSPIKQPTFTWTKPVGAVKFEIRYDTVYPVGYVVGDALSRPQTVIVGGPTAIPALTALSYKPPSPLLPGTYYWQVQAFDAAGNGSGWTALRTFKINSATTDTPVPNHFGPDPDPVTAGDQDPILLTWGPLSWVCAGGTPPCSLSYYEVQIDNNTTFTSPEYQLTNAVGNTVTYAEYIVNYGVIIPSGALPAGLPNGTWYWRVRGFNPTVGAAGAYGAYSSTGTFTVEK